MTLDAVPLLQVNGTPHADRSARESRPRSNSWGFGWHPLLYQGQGPPPRRCAGAVRSSSSELLLFGGLLHNDANASPRPDDRLNDLWRFCLNTRRWSKVAASPTRPSRRMAFSLLREHSSERAWLFGGISTSGAVADMYTLDLRQLEWKRVPLRGMFPSKRAYHGCAQWGHRLVFFGGTELKRFFSDVFLFDLQSGRWERPTLAHGPAPKGRAGCAMAIHGDHMLVYGGWNRFEYLADTWSLDLRTMTWSRVPTMGTPPPGLSGMSCTLYLNALVIHGGNNASGPRSDVYALDLETRMWSWVMAPVRGAGHRTDHASVRVDSTLYIMCGLVEEDGCGSNDMWKCDLPALLGDQQRMSSSQTPSPRKGRPKSLSPLSLSRSI